MTLVSGELVTVGLSPASYDFAYLHAPRVRAGSGQNLIVEEPKRIKLSYAGNNNNLTFKAEPGPAVLSLLRQGRVVEAVPLLVSDGGSQSLADAVKAGRLAEGRDASELEAILGEIARKIESVASTTRWVGPRLEVNGVRSPDLRGPKGAPGDVSMADFRPVRDAALNRPNGWIIPSESQLNATERKARPGDLIHVVETRETWEVY